MKDLEKTKPLKLEVLMQKDSLKTKIDLTKIKGGLNPSVVPTGQLVGDDGNLNTDGRWCC